MHYVRLGSDTAQTVAHQLDARRPVAGTKKKQSGVLRTTLWGKVKLPMATFQIHDAVTRLLDVRWCKPKLTVRVKHLAASKTLRHATVSAIP